MKIFKQFLWNVNKNRFLRGRGLCEISGAKRHFRSKISEVRSGVGITGRCSASDGNGLFHSLN
jgi:hypothetical protein